MPPASSLNNLAGICLLKGKYKEAFGYLKRSDYYRQNENGNYGRVENLILYGNIYYRLGDLNSAISKYEECLDLSEDINQGYQIRYCYEQLAKIYEQKKDYKNALLTKSKYISIKDSVLNLQTHAKIAELEIAYETERKDRQIAEKNLDIRQKRDQLFLAFGIIVILIIMAIWIYRSQKLKRERIQREFEFEKKLKQTEFEKQLADDKVRISRELHDNIGSQLTFMIGSIDNLAFAEKDSKSLKKLSSLSEFGKNTLKELRTTIWAMKHEGAELNQLVLKLNELKQQVKHFELLE